jgi:hypothetical protein
MNHSTQMFIITNENGTKTVTDMAWRGLYLENHSIDDVLFNARFTSKDYLFEKTSDDNNNIQYYKTADRAQIVLNALHNREREPVLETLKIVKLNIVVELEDVFTATSQKAEYNKRMMEEFESEISFIGKPEYFADNAKTPDYSAFKFAIVQDFYQSWKIRKGYTN